MMIKIFNTKILLIWFIIVFCSGCIGRKKIKLTKEYLEEIENAHLSFNEKFFYKSNLPDKSGNEYNNRNIHYLLKCNSNPKVAIRKFHGFIRTVTYIFPCDDPNMSYINGDSLGIVEFWFRTEPSIKPKISIVLCNALILNTSK